MAEAQKDTRSEMTKKFQKIAAEIVTPLRRASDDRERVTPATVRTMQERVQHALEQVHYGFHPDLE